MAGAGAALPAPQPCSTPDDRLANAHRILISGQKPPASYISLIKVGNADRVLGCRMSVGSCTPTWGPGRRVGECGGQARLPMITPGGHLQKRLQEDGEVHLAALGSALNTLVTVTEMMKNRHLAVEVSMRTSLKTLRDEMR